MKPRRRGFSEDNKEPDDVEDVTTDDIDVIEYVDHKSNDGRSTMMQMEVGKADDIDESFVSLKPQKAGMFVRKSRELFKDNFAFRMMVVGLCAIVALGFLYLVYHSLTNKDTYLVNELGKYNLPFRYRHLKGKITEKKFDSGMKWLHIDNSEYATSGFSIRIAAGSFDEYRPDYETYDGMAHLLEHSIFLRQTDEEKQLFTYWNAFTDSQETQYISTSTAANLPQALNVTIRALFNFTLNPETATEVKAVDSE